MNHRDLSEVVFGLVLESRLPASAVCAEYFDTPYDTGIEILQQKGATREDVAKTLNSQFISDAHDAVHKWNGVGDKENFDWVKALVDAHKGIRLSKTFKKAAKRLEENEPVDLLPLFGDLQSIVAGSSVKDSKSLCALNESHSSLHIHQDEDTNQIESDDHSHHHQLKNTQHYSNKFF